MSFDAYIQIKDAPGESTDDKHKDWIEISSYSHHIHQPASATASSAGGATAERVEHGTFDFVHLLDKATPKLFEFCCTGKHLPEVAIELCRAGGDKFKYMEIKLSAVIVSTISTNASSRGDSNFPTETISLSYGKIEATYFQQKRADGSGGGQVRAGWDLMKNAKA
jgi:type VI secretion system secreted protein Hcp